ncbi:MAG: mannose-6-phosphate isomerase, class I [Bdellovibrionales bacterium]|nr:mannose-6-phosphate isomerase, class I [Bdellovibrionales bacterium]
MPVINLFCPVMHYSWGRKGSASLAAKLYQGAVVEDQPYAELWLGVHSKAQSRIGGPDGEELGSYIKRESSALLGASMTAAFGDTLPFMLKVLSIDQPLSIQAHPNREQAVKLHTEDPLHYPDGNHKPEIAVALTEVELLSGLRADIGADDLRKQVPELGRLAAGASSVWDMFEQLMLAYPQEIGRECKSLEARLEAQENLIPAENWALRLCRKYRTGDRGIFCLFLLNFTKLKPGEAIFTSPGVPHAYLSGDILECMANSDNVVRAGLTDKHIDVPTLLSILSAEKSPAVETSVSDGVCWYLTEAKEFKLGLAQGPLKAELPACAKVILSIDGVGELTAGSEVVSFEPGAAYFLGADSLKTSLSMKSGRLAIAQPNL